LGYPIPPTPEDPNSAINLVLRVPDGSRISRRFSVENFIGHILSWALSEQPQLDKTKSYGLLSTHPRIEYSELHKKLSELGISGSPNLVQ